MSIQLALWFLNKNNLIIDNEGSSSGVFAKNFLQNFTLENISIFTKLYEDRNSLNYDLKNDAGSYAILFESQIRKNQDLQIIARKKDKNIFYRALVIAGDNMDVAREFLKFLKMIEIFFNKIIFFLTKLIYIINVSNIFFF